MKVKFQHEKMKLLIARVSGVYNIYDEKNKTWDKKYTKGSFKINKPELYNEVLEKIVTLKPLRRYVYDFAFREGTIHDMLSVRGRSKLEEIGYDCYLPAYLIFETKNGIIDQALPGNPRYKKPIEMEGKIFFYSPEMKHSFRVKDKKVLSEIDKCYLENQ